MIKKLTSTIFALCVLLIGTGSFHASVMAENMDSGMHSSVHAELFDYEVNHDQHLQQNYNFPDSSGEMSCCENDQSGQQADVNLNSAASTQLIKYALPILHFANRVQNLKGDLEKILALNIINGCHSPPNLTGVVIKKE